MEIVAGIYQITLHKRIYIGQSKNINSRIRCHLSELKNGTHTNRRLQTIFKKHGGDDFSYEIVEVMENYDSVEILKREAYYIETLKPYYNTGSIGNLQESDKIKLDKINLEINSLWKKIEEQSQQIRDMQHKYEDDYENASLLHYSAVNFNRGYIAIMDGTNVLRRLTEVKKPKKVKTA